MNAPTPLSTDHRQRLSRQIDTWRKDLLPTDRRQRALYFSHTKSASLEIVGPSLHGVVDLVETGRADDEYGPPDPESLPYATALTVVGKSEASLATALRTLERKSRQTLADSGFWTLYLGLGILRWIDPDDGKTVDSPILLVPVRLHRLGVNEPFRCERTEDDVVVNPVVSLKMDKSFDIQLPSGNAEDVDLDVTLASVQSLIAGRSGWAVVNRCVMTTFSFHKEAMYRDLSDHETDIADNPLIQLLALGPDAPCARDYTFGPIPDETLDQDCPPEDLLSILDADGSQRKCIAAARAGRSFVMDGPPGTGKSQTIANIIVELMSVGKSVLFVSEKAAALDVVRNRLAEAKLDEFVLEMHSHTATRKAVVTELDRALTKRITATYRFSATDRSALQSARKELNRYAEALNENRPEPGGSVHHVLGRLSQLHELDRFYVANPADFADLSAERFADIRAAADDLQRYWRPVPEGHDFLWRDLRSNDMDDALVGHFARAAQKVADQTNQLIDRIRSIDDDLVTALPRTLVGAQQREQLLTLAESRPPAVETAWLSADVDHLTRRAEALKHLDEQVRTRTAALDADLTTGASWRDLDVNMLSSVEALLPDNTSAWRPSAATDVVAYRELHEFLMTTDPVAEIRDDANWLATLFGVEQTTLSPKRAAELAELGMLATSSTPPDPMWLNPNVQAALDESARVLHHLVDAVREREKSLGEVFTPAALELDLTALIVRFRDTHKGLRKLSKQARIDKKLLKTVTVSGRVDKAILARLDEAVTWQSAQRALSAGEAEHGSRLAGYYRGTATDFGRLSEAMDNAQTAIRLAGDDLNPRALARQIALDGEPDPQITVVARRLTAACAAWRSNSHRHLSEQSTLLDARPFAEIIGWMDDRALEIAPGVAALASVSGVWGRPASPSDGVTLLREATTLATIETDLARNYEADQSELGPGYTGVGTDWETITHGLAWAKTVQSAKGGALTPATGRAVMSPTFSSSDVSGLIESWTEARDGLREAFLINRSEDLRAELDADLRNAATLAADMATMAANDIPDWCSFADARSRLVKRGLGDVVTDLEGELARQDIVADSLERAVLTAWADHTIRLDPRLSKFRSKDRDTVVADFRQLDARLVAESHATVATQCNARRPVALNGTAAARIRREAQKKSRHIPIRQLLDETGELVKQLKPCLMMSPLSVSHFLPPGFRFDAVIFDEASQVLPSDAVNCVYRGTQLIVAGDQKQLPPTSFFTGSIDDDSVDEDDVEPDVFDSLLDLCKAGSIPSLPLQWHYRSQHEALITFSNVKFYEGSLFTFPGARFEAPDLGVVHHLVDGVYRRGSTRDNLIEAETIVDRVLFHRQHHPKQSLGVVTFSSAQEDAIARVLEIRGRQHHELAALLDDDDRLDGFFVKNLENVQGDERDIILFSVGYGPDEHGKLTNNFGPINKAGGWRRLNVAITRARRRVEVVSSFTAGQMPESENESLRFLRAYLDFAARGPDSLTSDLTGSLGDPESVFEEDVLRVITSLGYEGVPQIGAAGYRIDIGVRHPTRPGEYLVGVECDGAAYHSSKVARDRDRLREEVLSRLGWRLHRIWGISWVCDRHGQVERLRTALEGALHGPAPAPRASLLRESAVEMQDIDPDTSPDWAVPYRIGGEAQWLEWVPDAPEARPRLRRYFEGLLDIEAPMHDDVLLHRMRHDLDIGRVGWRIRDNVDRAIEAARVNGQRITPGPDGFYRIEGRTVEQVRVPDGDHGMRDVAHVPPEELNLAVQRLVADAVLISHGDLKLATCRIFGWRRLGGDIQQRAIERSIATLIHDGTLIETPNGDLKPGSSQ